MANDATIVRKSFNGGEITPELHYRSDLESYHKSCKTLKNMVVTPWGMVTRRPPTRHLKWINHTKYGVPIKYIPFRFSLTETFNIVITDGSGTDSPDSSTADMIVYDNNGVIQTLDGVSTDILNTPYAPADINNIQHIQVNDFIYLTCGGDYPVQEINRFFDDDQSDNRWSFKEYDFLIPPFEEQNLTESNFLKITPEGLKVADQPYSKGQVVRGTDYAYTISSIQFIELNTSNSGLTESYLEIKTSSNHNMSVNQDVSIAGVTATGGDYVWKDTNDDITGSIQGRYLVHKIVDATTIQINKIGVGTTAPSFTLSTPTVTRWGSVLYESIIDGNNQPLTDAAAWQEVDTLSGQLSAYSSNFIFTADDVGRYIRIKTDAEPARLKDDWVMADMDLNTIVSQAIPATGVVTLSTDGSWGGKLHLETSIDNGVTFKSIGVIQSRNASNNGSLEREISDPRTLVRVRVDDLYIDPAATYTLAALVWELKINNHYRYFKIKEYVNTGTVYVDTVSPITSANGEYRWSLDSFSTPTGYPKTLCIHDERMVFGGTDEHPNTVWASRVNAWDNFLTDSTDISPYTFTLATDSYDSIRWMVSARNLMIGTENSESTMSSRDENSVISPTNINVKTHTHYGSNKTRAMVTSDLVFFIQGQGKRVRSTQYDFASDQYLSSEMSIFANHITLSGIKEMCYRRNPYTNLFFLLDDGTAALFTYEKDNQIKGWTTFSINSGTIISSGSNYSESGDVIMLIVERDGDYMLEELTNSDDNTVYLDSQTSYTEDFTTAKTVSRYPLSSVTKVVYEDRILDDSEYTLGTVLGGDFESVLTIPAYTTGEVTIGYAFDSEVEPTDVVEFGEHGPTKRATKVNLYLINSGNFDVKINDIDTKFPDGILLEPTERLNGSYDFTVGGGHQPSISVKLSTNNHQPLNLLGIGYNIR